MFFSSRTGTLIIKRKREKKGRARFHKKIPCISVSFRSFPFFSVFSVYFRCFRCFRCLKKGDHCCDLLSCELRRLDSNRRPPGYEPGELPTAPLRDVKNAKQQASSVVCGCKGSAFSWNCQAFSPKNALSGVFLHTCAKSVSFFLGCKWQKPYFCACN